MSLLREYVGMVHHHGPLSPPSPPPGGITAGLVSDLLQARAITCVTMLILAIPSVSLVQSNGQSGIGYCKHTRSKLIGSERLGCTCTKLMVHILSCKIDVGLSAIAVHLMFGPFDSCLSWRRMLMKTLPSSLLCSSSLGSLSTAPTL